MTSTPGTKSHYTVSVVPHANAIDQTDWERLYPNDAEAFGLHAAFDQGHIEGFKTGYIVIRDEHTVALIAPYFITEYRLDTTVQGPLKRVLNKIKQVSPGLFSIRILCVGSAVTDSCKVGIQRHDAFNPKLLETLCEALERVAKQEKASVVAFKDVIEDDSALWDHVLSESSYGKVTNMPVAVNPARFENLDGYLASLSYSTRKDLRRKLKSKQHLRIEEVDGLPDNMEAIYQLYLQTFERSELQFEKLTIDFFRALAVHMPNQCRYVLYYLDDILIAFNLVLHRDGVLYDKYIGLEKYVAKEYNVYFLSWLHNMEMCTRDGFHTYQSGQAAYETKIKLGAQLKQTYIYFRHRNRLLNKPLKLLANMLAYANFDSSVKAQENT